MRCAYLWEVEALRIAIVALSAADRRTRTCVRRLGSMFILPGRRCASRIAATSDRIEPFLQPEPWRTIQRVQRTILGAAAIARDARLPARPEHLARLRPEVCRQAERRIENRPINDSISRADMDLLHLVPERRLLLSFPDREAVPPRAGVRFLLTALEGFPSTRSKTGCGVTLPSDQGRRAQPLPYGGRHRAPRPLGGVPSPCRRPGPAEASRREAAPSPARTRAYPARRIS